MVPAISGRWAPDLVELASARAGERVLDVASWPSPFPGPPGAGAHVAVGAGSLSTSQYSPSWRTASENWVKSTGFTM
jgi:hypothetical protein